MEQLATIASSQPHAAYSALTYSLIDKWAYISRTVSNVTDQFLLYISSYSVGCSRRGGNV